MRSADSNAHGAWQLDGGRPTRLSAALQALRARIHLFRGSGLVRMKVDVELKVLEQYKLQEGLRPHSTG